MSQGRKNIPLKFTFYFSSSIDNILIEMILETRARILDARQDSLFLEFSEIKVCKNRIAEIKKSIKDCDERIKSFN